MVSDPQIVVEPACDWEAYSQAWSMAMEHLYWYQESPVFDFNKSEEIDEMQTDFGKPGHLFLAAHVRSGNEIIGVLGLRYRDVMARVRRWEPAISPEYQEHGVESILLEHALEYLVSMGVKRVGCLVKHPEGSPETADGILNLYRDAGFVRNRPDSVDMVLDIRTLGIEGYGPEGVLVETGESYTFEDLASITVKSFTSTPKEREIHGFDKTVTEHIQATLLLQRMAEGFYGHSPDDLRKIAVVDGVPVGFLAAFIVESKYKPMTGVLGPMAVLPAFRRKGIALHLIEQQLAELKKLGCEFAVIGTPAANSDALALYRKAGFKIACRIISLEKEL